MADDIGRITRRVIEVISEWDPLGGPDRWPDARFDLLAGEIFAHQYARNDAYRSFCDGRNVTPAVVDEYRDVPAVPTDAFKHVRLTTTSDPARTFRTSGTTTGDRGEHHFGTLEVYRASLEPPFRRFCMPDRDSIRMLVVAPSANALPDSSLSFMLSELFEDFATPESEFLVERDDEGTLDLRLDALRNALDRAEADGEPVFLLGTAFGFVELFDSTDASWSLPDGSRLMETGGFKGKSREVSRDKLYEMFGDRFDLPPTSCVSEYSMTELSSQAYTDDLLRRHVEDASDRRGILRTPPWARVEIVDPASLEVISEPNSRGLIRWYDLANVGSVLAVQTTDMGERTADGGFRLFGRAPDSDLRGCSLTIEEIVDAN